MKKVNQSFPPDAELKKINRILSNPKKSANIALPPEATMLQRVKYEICQKIALYRRTENLTQRELAKVLEIDESRVSDILYGKIYRFSLDRLLEIFQKAYPHAKFKLTA